MSEEDADDSSKTEDASSKKLEEARKKGQVPKSTELPHFFGILMLTVIVAIFVPVTGGQLTRELTRFLAQADQVPTDAGGLGNVLTGTTLHVLLFLSLPALALVVIALVGGTVQNGIVISAESLIPKLSKISPLTGFKRIFSVDSLLNLLRSIAKLAVVGSISLLMLMPAFDAVDHYVQLSMAALLMETWHLAIRVLIAVLVSVLIIGLADMLYQRFKFAQDMRMTKQEVKDEYKQQEGDPMVKGRIRQIRMERARQRMMANVPKSDVVVTNPTHYAVALKYDPEKMDAPMVVAKGVDEVAARIRDLAKEHKVPIMRNPPLARALYATCDIEEMVPAEHFRAVAEIISYVFRMKGRKLG